MSILYLIMVLIVLYAIGWILLLPFRLIGSAANNLRLKNSILKADLEIKKSDRKLEKKHQEEQNEIYRKLFKKDKSDAQNVVHLIK